MIDASPALQHMEKELEFSLTFWTHSFRIMDEDQGQEAARDDWLTQSYL